DLEGAQTIIAAIKDTPDDMPIDLVLHTPGGLVLAAMQIARAVEAHKAKVTVYVPVYAMSGGTLIALAADEIALGEFSVLGHADIDIAVIGVAYEAVAAKSIRRSPDFPLRVSSKPATRSLLTVSSTSQWFSPIWGRRLSPRLSEGR